MLASTQLCKRCLDSKSTEEEDASSGQSQRSVSDAPRLRAYQRRTSPQNAALNPRLKGILWDQIGTLGKDGHPIDDEPKVCSSERQFVSSSKMVRKPILWLL